MSTLRDNLLYVEERIRCAAERAGTPREAITLVAVTKGVDVERINQAADLGIEHIGENRVQEAQGKWQSVVSTVQWHMVGHLQSNKAGVALQMFSLIHSLDRPSLLKALARRTAAAGKTARVLIQVNTSGETSKSGIDQESAEEFILTASATPGVVVEGLMTIGPLMGGPQAARPGFAYLRQLAERLRAQKLPNLELPYLSMGMSADYEEAILEGATMIRVGTAIFGARQ